MRHAVGSLLMAGCLAWTTVAQAQVPGVLGVEAWGGAAVGAYEHSGAGLEMVPRAAWGAGVSWGPSERLGAYAAFASVPFGCDGGFCRGADVKLASRGFSFGARAQAAIRGEPWLQAGLLLHSFHQEWGGTARGSASSQGVGAEAAAGITWRLADRIALTPGLHIGVHSSDAPDGVSESVLFSAVRVGLRYRF
jgi:opacity protein-like surface antigen